MADWVLTGPAFEMLLKSLESSGADYVAVRDRIHKLLLCNRVREADIEDLIDKAFDRTAKRIEEGVEVRNPVSYITQVARYLVMEYWDSPERRVDGSDSEQSFLDGLKRGDENDRTELEGRLECLEKCAAGLPEAERQRVIDYYYDERRVKINNRKRIAEGLGISLNNLRVRMHRTREKLEKCILACLKKGEE
jgi:RNA polymerase sigma factor (sigma-70 family)